MEIIYKVNGKEFNTQEKAAEYEKELVNKEQERIKKAQEKKARLNEVIEAENKYVALWNKYHEDYKTDDVKLTLRGTADYKDFINSILDALK